MLTPAPPTVAMLTPAPPPANTTSAEELPVGQNIDLSFLTLLAGDVEVNPGPGNEGQAAPAKPVQGVQAKPKRGRPKLKKSPLKNPLIEDKKEYEKRCDCADEQCECQSHECVYCPCEDFSQTKNSLQCTGCFTWFHLDCANLKGLGEEDVRKLDKWTCCRCWAAVSPLARKLLMAGLSEVAVGNTGDVTLNDLKDEIDVLKGLVNMSQMSSPPAAGQNQNQVSGNDGNTIRLILKEELHLTSSVMATQIEEKVTKAVVAKTKAWTEILKTKQSVNLDKDMLEEIVNKSSDHVVESSEIKNSDTEYQRRRRLRNVVIQKVPECEDKDPKAGEKRKSFDMKFVTQTLGIDKNDVVSCFRAGKHSRDAVKPRPLIVTLKTDELVEWHSDQGNGYRVENLNNPKEPFWINKDLCAADAEAGFRARKAADLKRKEREKERLQEVQGSSNQ